MANCSNCDRTGPDLLGGRLAELIGRREPDLDPGGQFPGFSLSRVRCLILALILVFSPAASRFVVFLTPPLTTTVESMFVVARSATFFSVRLAPVGARPRAPGAGPTGSGW